MKWENILEAICAAPSIILDKIVTDIKDFTWQEKELMQFGEYDEEEIKAEQEELSQNP